MARKKITYISFFSLHKTKCFQRYFGFNIKNWIYPLTQSTIDTLFNMIRCLTKPSNATALVGQTTSQPRKRKIASTLTFLGGCFAATSI